MPRLFAPSLAYADVPFAVDGGRGRSFRKRTGPSVPGGLSSVGVVDDDFGFVTERGNRGRDGEIRHPYCPNPVIARCCRRSSVASSRHSLTDTRNSRRASLAPRSAVTIPGGSNTGSAIALCVANDVPLAGLAGRLAAGYLAVVAAIV